MTGPGASERGGVPDRTGPLRHDDPMPPLPFSEGTLHLRAGDVLFGRGVEYAENRWAVLISAGRQRRRHGDRHPRVHGAPLRPRRPSHGLVHLPVRGPSVPRTRDALDAVRSAHRTGLGLPSQRAAPPAGACQSVTQAAADLVHSAEHCEIVRRDLGMTCNIAAPSQTITDMQSVTAIGGCQLPVGRRCSRSRRRPAPPEPLSGKSPRPDPRRTAAAPRACPP